MKKEEYQELLLLSMYGELQDEEAKKLGKYLKVHPEMELEAGELRKFKEFVSSHSPESIGEDMLHDARRKLRKAIREEGQSNSFIARLNERVKDFFSTPWKLAFSGSGILALGMLIGYCSHPSLHIDTGMMIQPVAVDNSSYRQQTEIKNIKFIDADASDGIIEFQFDAVAPMHVKGKIDDPGIQKMLAHALLNATNDGVRLRTVNAIAQQADKGSFADSTIERALIKTVTMDENPGVRREALKVLQQYRFDVEIRDALLRVLANDENSGMRVAAINALDLARIDGNRFDSSSVIIMKNQIEKEKNNYIRNRAVNFVKEIYQ